MGNHGKNSLCRKAPLLLMLVAALALGIVLMGGVVVVGSPICLIYCLWLL